MKGTLSILIGVILVITSGLASAGCVPTVPPPTGAVEVHVTDAPPREEVTGVLVTVSGVEIHKAVAEQEQTQQGEGEPVQVQQQAQQDEGEWLNISIIEGANPFDLLRIEGIEELLATSEVEAGKYTQIRLTIDKVEVALGGGAPQEATVPSGTLKFVRPFDVVAGETTIILLDFDADKSVTVTGAGKTIVNPVVKLNVQQGATVLSQEESQQIAEDFVRNSPTFVFDGIEDTLELTDTITLRCPSCWQFVFEFDSSSAGYGDRTGQVLAQVITPHQAIITVVRGEVTEAVMDAKWDMINQELIDEEEETPEGTLSVAELLENPVYDTEVKIYGEVSLLGELLCPCFELTSDEATLQVWYGLMVEDDGTERPSVSVEGIENGDLVIVTGELKTAGVHRSLNDFWASSIEKIE